MTKDDDLRELSKEEDKVKLYWDEVINHLRTPEGRLDLGIYGPMK